MTETTRLEMIQTAFRYALDGGVSIPTALGGLSPTVKELLKIAFTEPKLSSHFDVDTVLELPNEDEAWEDAQRNQKEIDDILSTILAPMKITIPNDDEDEYDEDDNDEDEDEDEDENHNCFTCGAACVAYQAVDDIFWICEECENRRGCASCSGCQYCMASGGYDGADEV